MPKAIDPLTLRVLLHYDRKTGKLYWRERQPHSFERADAAKQAAWNTKYAGKEAFTIKHKGGYRCGSIFHQQHFAHRVIWAMVQGHWPTDKIDHINGNPADNRIENLRAVSHGENMRNTRRPKDNTSGVVGVCWSKVLKKWKCTIQVKGKPYTVGVFTDFELAAAARKEAQAWFGYHPNHGRG